MSGEAVESFEFESYDECVKWLLPRFKCLVLLFRCDKCLLLKEPLFANGNCQHRLCYNCCVLALETSPRVRCGAANCSRFFTAGNRREDLKVKPVIKKTLQLICDWGLTVEDVVNHVIDEQRFNLNRYIENMDSGNCETLLENSQTRQCSSIYSTNDDDDSLLLGYRNEELSDDNIAQMLSTRYPVMFSISESQSPIKIQNKKANSPKKLTPRKSFDVFDLPMSQSGNSLVNRSHRSKSADTKARTSKSKPKYEHTFSEECVNAGQKKGLKRALISMSGKDAPANNKRLKSNHKQVPKMSASAFAHLVKDETSDCNLNISSNISKSALNVKNVTDFSDEANTSSHNKTSKQATSPTKKSVLNSISTTPSKLLEDTGLNRYNKVVSTATTPTPMSASVIRRKLTKRDFRGETELHRECKRGNLDKVIQLLQLGADPNTKDNINLTPLHEHKTLQNVDICRLLLEYGADARVHGGDENLTPLHIAVQLNSVQVIPLLIRHGADINAKAKTAEGDEITPLSLAQVFNKSDIVSLLEEESEKFNNSNKDCHNDSSVSCIRTPVVYNASKFNTSELILDKPLSAAIEGSIRFSTSALDKPSRKKCLEFSKMFKTVRHSESYELNCNVLVIASRPSSLGYTSGQESEQKTCPKTKKAMLAMLTNGVIVDMDWVEAGLSTGKVAQLDPYFVDTIADFTDSIVRARKAHSSGTQKLFHGLQVFIRKDRVGEGFKNSIGLTELTELLTFGGAKLLSREPKYEGDNINCYKSVQRPAHVEVGSGTEDMRFVIIGGDIFGSSNCNESKKKGDGANGDSKMLQQVAPGFYHATVEWVVYCICSFSIVDK